MSRSFISSLPSASVACSGNALLYIKLSLTWSTRTSKEDVSSFYPAVTVRPPAYGAQLIVTLGWGISKLIIVMEGIRIMF
jgi:hypothetical protein